MIALFAGDIGYGVYMQTYGIKHGIDTTINHHIPIY